MTQLKLKLNLRQTRVLLFAFGVLSFLACLFVAAWLGAWPESHKNIANKPASEPSSSKLTEPKPRKLNLNDFRPALGVRLQGEPKPDPKVKAKKKPPKPRIKPVAKIKLLGVFLGLNEDSFGIFQTNGKENVVKLGDTVGLKGPVLTEVAKGHVLVRYGQQPPQKIELLVKKR